MKHIDDLLKEAFAIIKFFPVKEKKEGLEIFFAAGKFHRNKYGSCGGLDSRDSPSYAKKMGERQEYQLDMLRAYAIRKQEE